MEDLEIWGIFVLNISIYQGYQLIISNNNIKGVEAHCAEIFLILLCIFCCAPVWVIFYLFLFLININLFKKSNKYK